MPVNYTVTNTNFSGSDLDYILLRRDIFHDGTMWAWGMNTAGQLGNNTTVSKSAAVNTSGGGNTWEALAITFPFAAGIKSDGTLWTWGSGTYGRLGSGSTASRSSPGTIAGAGTNWEEVSVAGGAYGAAIKNDGTLWTWGRAQLGQLGDGTIVNKSSPVTVAGGFTDWLKVSCGYTTAAAVRDNGTLWTWGSNLHGQLGNSSLATGGAGDSRSSPITTTGGGTTWKDVSGGLNFFVALKTDNTAWAWGINSFFNLGDGTTVSKSSPVSVIGGAVWRNVAAGAFHAAGVRLDGTLWTWGRGTYGALGSNATTHNTSPVTVTGGGTNWKTVSCGGQVTAAIKTDGTLWTWGYNVNGELGSNSTASRSSPALVDVGVTNLSNNLEFINNWKEIALGYHPSNFTNNSSLGISEDVTNWPIIKAYTVPGSYTETIPEGQTSVIIEIWGAGGGSGYSATPGSYGGGGGAGAYVKSYYSTLGQVGKTISLTVGTGGTAGTNIANGGTGGTTTASTNTFTITTMTASGGLGGVSAPGGAAGAGGSTATGGNVQNTTGAAGASYTGGVGTYGRTRAAYGNGASGQPGATVGGDGAIIIIYQ